MQVQLTPELVTSIAALVTAIGGVIKGARDRRREHRKRRNELEQVARAAAHDAPRVAAVVDELEQTGAFERRRKK